jgi:hypothetical protein
LDGSELAAGKTVGEKEKIWNKEIRKASLKVAAYIALAFKKISKIALLYGYHTTSSKFNSILKALFDILCSMQKSLYVTMIKFLQQPLDLYRCRT